MIKLRKYLFSFLIVIFILTLGIIIKDQNQKSIHLNKSKLDLSNKNSHYVCPMHPEVMSNKPGTCPVCGMDLVAGVISENPSQQHQHINEKIVDHENNNSTEHTIKLNDHSEFQLSLEQQQMVGVKIGRVEKKSLFKSIRAPGRIAFDPELYTAQSEFLEAIKQWNQIKNSPLSDVRENTQQMIRSSRIRLKVLGLSDEQITKLSKKGTQSEGLLVGGKGQENWIYADIFEVDLPFIKKGLSTQVSANFLQGKTLAGKVVSVDQVIDPNTKTAKVRIQLLENHPSMRPESYVNINIFAPLGEHLSVPLEAILDTGREAYVFVKKEDEKFEPRMVSIILEANNDVAISGVQEGELVVLGANFLLDSESRLRSVINKNYEKANKHHHE